jgi:hypothetical protein
VDQFDLGVTKPTFLGMFYRVGEGHLVASCVDVRRAGDNHDQITGRFCKGMQKTTDSKLNLTDIDLS